MRDVGPDDIQNVTITEVHTLASFFDIPRLT